MTSSQCSFRSMELLSPEPPRELSISLESDPEQKSPKSQNSRKKKSSKKSKSKVSSSSLTGSETGSMTGSESSRKSPKSSKSKIESGSVTGSATGSEIELGMKLISKYEVTLGELKLKHSQIREETEILRRENAEGFYKYRHLIGNNKGEIILQNLYFQHYPHLALLESAETAEPADVTEIETGNPLENSPNSDFYSIFYQTEVQDPISARSRSSGPRPETQSSFATVDVLTGSEIGDFERSKSMPPPVDFIKRNIELAQTGDGLTKEERERLELILEDDDEIQGPDFNSEVLQMAKINNTLENEYSRTTPLTVSSLPAITSGEDELDRLTEINSQLAILETENNPLRVQTSSTLMITDRPNSELSECSLLPSETISEMMHSLHQDFLTGSEALTEINSKISEEKLKELLAEAKTELNLE